MRHIETMPGEPNASMISSIINLVCTVRRTHEWLRMLRQVRQELAPGMGVGVQRYEEA